MVALDEGVQHIIQMDPESQTAHRYEDGSLIQTIFDGLRLQHTTIPFDSGRLFAQLHREADEAAAND